MSSASRNHGSALAPASTLALATGIALALLASAGPAFASTWGTPVCTVEGDQAPVVLVPATLPGPSPQVGAFTVWEDHRFTTSSPTHLYWKWLGSDLGSPTAPADGQLLVDRPGSQFAARTVMVGPGDCGDPNGCSSLVAAYVDLPNPSSATAYALRLVRLDDLGQAWDVAVADPVPSASEHDVVAAGDGAGGAEGVIVGWIGQSAVGSARLRVQRFSAAGARQWGADGEWVVPDDAVGQVDVAMATSPGGGAFLAWQDNRQAPDVAVYVTRLGLDGAPAPGWPAGGVPARVDSHSLDFVRLVPDAADGVFVVWSEFRTTSGGALVPQARVQHILGDGSRSPGWPADGVWLFDRPDDAFALGLADVQSDHLGGIVALASLAEPGMLLQRLAADGSFPAGWPAAGTELSSIPGLPYGGSLAVGPDGMVTAIWSDASEGFDSMYLLGARFLSDGSRPEGWPAIGVTVARTGGTGQPRVAPAADGGVLAVWPDLRNAATSGTDLFGQVVSAMGRGNVGVGGTAEVSALELSFASTQPASGVSRFRLALPATGHVTAEVFDLSGRRLGVLAEGAFSAGVHELRWDGADVAATGVCFLRVRTASGERSLRFVRLP